LPSENSWAKDAPLNSVSFSSSVMLDTMWRARSAGATRVSAAGATPKVSNISGMLEPPHVESDAVRMGSVPPMVPKAAGDEPLCLCQPQREHADSAPVGARQGCL
jgi:hypothetical protein